MKLSIPNKIPISKEDLEKAPVFKLASTTFDLGKIPGSTQKEVEFKFTNTGKSDLVIRHVKSTCGCTAVMQTQGSSIKPGQSSSIKAIFNSGSFIPLSYLSFLIFIN